MDVAVLIVGYRQHYGQAQTILPFIVQVFEVAGRCKASGRLIAFHLALITPSNRRHRRAGHGGQVISSLLACVVPCFRSAHSGRGDWARPPRHRCNHAQTYRSIETEQTAVHVMLCSKRFLQVVHTELSTDKSTSACLASEAQTR